MRKIFALACCVTLLSGQRVAMAELATTFDFPKKPWIVGCNDFWGTCAFPDRWHLGEDASAIVGDVIRSSANGTVKHVGLHTDYGFVVIVEHQFPTGEKVCTISVHLQPNVMVQEGQVVKLGDVLGFIADSAQNGGWPVHFHLGMKKGAYSSYNYMCQGELLWCYGGYTKCADQKDTWYDPSDFIRAHSVMQYVGHYADGSINQGILNCHDTLIPDAQPSSNNNGGLYVHEYWSQDGSGHVTIQDFYDPATNGYYAIIDNPSMNQAFLLKGGFRWFYTSELQGNGPTVLNKPTSDEYDTLYYPYVYGVFDYTAPATNPTVMQSFSPGSYLVWPKNTNIVAKVDNILMPTPGQVQIAIVPAISTQHFTISAQATGSDYVLVSITQNTAYPNAFGYIVYRNGVEITRISGPEFSDFPLQPSTTFTYELAAIISSGLILGYSNTVVATTSAPVTPSPTPYPTPTPNPIVPFELTDHRLGSPPPYVMGGAANVIAVLRNTTGSPVNLERVQEEGYFKDQWGYIFYRGWRAIQFSPPRVVNPGEIVSFEMTLDDLFPNGVPTTAVTKAMVKLYNVAGQYQVVQAAAGVEVELHFDVVDPRTLNSDLAMQMSIVPNPLTTADQAMLVGSVENIGTGAALASNMAVTTTWNSPTALGIPALGPGESYPLAMSLGQAPLGLQGVEVTLDATGANAELSETNNQHLFSFTVNSPPTPTPTPSSTPTPPPTPSPTPSPSPSRSPTPSPSHSPTPTKTPTPTPTPSSTPSKTPSPTPTPSASPTKTTSPTPTPSPTATKKPRKTPRPTASPTPTSSPTRTATSTPSPTSSPSGTPTASPTSSPSPSPSPTPSPTPLSYPVPQLAFIGTENYTAGGTLYTRYKLSVTNWQQFPDSIFALDPSVVCGTPNACRTWVYVYSVSATGSRTLKQSFCRLGYSTNLQNLWFALPAGTAAPPYALVKLKDQITGASVESNSAAISP